MTIGYHEAYEALSPQSRDMHRAISSLYEEIEAIDWYNQRIELAADEELKSILAHNRDEEMEHAAMLLEWMRRRVPAWDTPLRTYLFTETPLTQLEEAHMQGATEPSESPAPESSRPVGDLGIRKL